MLPGFARPGRSTLTVSHRRTAIYYRWAAVVVGRRVRPVRYMIFLPYANQDRRPLNAKVICTTIERRLDALSPEAVPGTDGRRLGIVVSSSRVSSKAELVIAVESILPDRGLFADAAY